MEPITFSPLYMERVWGGRELERLFNRQLPQVDVPYGESWEIVDREHEQSVVNEGPYQGKTLHELWTQHQEDIFGKAHPPTTRFPLLIKILDARNDLSIQVHPPAEVAATLDVEPKCEMWYVSAADPGAKLYLGLRRDVSRSQFIHALNNGTVAECVHSIEARPGDAIFIPSGRLHAIGAGYVIHEIQQNSDTTFRVFDWNRPGMDGKPRQLHMQESLSCIDFEDFEPSVDEASGNTLARCAFFQTDRLSLEKGDSIETSDEQFAVVIVLDGTLRSAQGRTFEKGAHLLLPRKAAPLTAASAMATALQVTVPPATS